MSRVELCSNGRGTLCDNGRIALCRQPPCPFIDPKTNFGWRDLCGDPYPGFPPGCSNVTIPGEPTLIGANGTTQCDADRQNRLQTAVIWHWELCIAVPGTFRISANGVAGGGFGGRDQIPDDCQGQASFTRGYVAVSIDWRDPSESIPDGSHRFCGPGHDFGEGCEGETEGTAAIEAHVDPDSVGGWLHLTMYAVAGEGLLWLQRPDFELCCNNSSVVLTNVSFTPD